MYLFYIKFSSLSSTTSFLVIILI